MPLQSNYFKDTFEWKGVGSIPVGANSAMIWIDGLSDIF